MAKSKKISNAQTLLNQYRPNLWRKSLLESVSEADNRALQDCVKQICFIQELVQTLRDNKLLGEKLYWIIYASYMTKQQMGDVEEILSYIAHKYEHIPRRTYFRLKGRAIQMLDKQLSELTVKDIDGKVVVGKIAS